MNNASIRQKIRHQRQQLPAETIATAAVDIAKQLWHLPSMQRARHIGCYFAVNGEADCQHVIADSWKRGKKTYLPVLEKQKLMFAPYNASTRFLRNSYGIPEPQAKISDLRKPQQLDVILMPLVAFDENGNRLGMGGGYYDRTLRFMHNRLAWQQPKLVGIAYSFQKVNKIEAFSWDVPLHYAIAETYCMKFSR